MSLPAAEDPAATARATPWDVNGDGYADLVVGAPGEDLGSATDAGGFHVLYGGPGGVTATGSRMYTQDTSGVPGTPEDGDWMGDVQASDDFNADGFADVAVAVLGENGTGLVYVFYGSSTGLVTSTVDVLSNEYSSEGGFGWDLATGDLNADGYGDLVASDPVNGTVKIYTGGVDGLSQSRASSEYGDGSAGFGVTLAVGDLDGDGSDDLAISEPFADPLGKGYPAGQVLVLYADGTFQSWSKDTPNLYGASASPGTDSDPDMFGYTLAIGDFNADGIGDLAAGAPGAPVTYTDSSGTKVKAQDAGTVNVIYGSGSGLTTTGNEHLHQATAGVPGTPRTSDWFGGTLEAGDADGDGDAELAVFSARENMVVVMNGAPSSGLYPTSAKAITQDTSGVPGSTEGEDQFGASLRFGDFASDGYADLAVGAPGENSWAGSVVVLKGTSSGISGTGAVAYSQNHSAIPGTSEADDWFGSYF